MAEPLATFDQAVAVTPSDATNFTQGKCRALYVGGLGAVAAVMGGVAVTFTAVPAGTMLWIGATRVNATNTTATNIVALY